MYISLVIKKMTILQALIHARNLITCTIFTLISCKINNQARGLENLEDVFRTRF